MMNRKGIIAAVVVVCMVGTYFGSPYWAIHQMRAAGSAGQGDRVAEYVDFPAVRESLRTQITAMMAKRMEGVDKDNPFAAMGKAFGTAMAGMVVDNLVTPEGLANMLAKGTAAKPKAEPAAPAAGAAPKSDGKQPRVEETYEGLDIFKVAFYPPDSDKQALVLVMHRDGIFTWKLKSVRMPTLDPANE